MKVSLGEGFSTWAMGFGSVANFFDDLGRPFCGHTYAASSANCWNAVSPLASSCPLRIMCAVSLPADLPPEAVLSQTFSVFRLLADFATCFSNKQAAGVLDVG
jgi:hypothetical protein